jgi:hypothetical protein
MRNIMLGNEHYPDRETEMPDKDHFEGLSKSFPYKEIFLDAAISAAISHTDDDMSEKLAQLDNRLRGMSRLHTPEDLEIAIAESVDRIVASRSSSRNAEMPNSVPDEIVIHGYSRRDLRILAACKDLPVQSVIYLLEDSAGQQQDNPIVQAIRDGNWLRMVP